MLLHTCLASCLCTSSGRDVCCDLVSFVCFCIMVSSPQLFAFIAFFLSFLPACSIMGFLLLLLIVDGLKYSQHSWHAICAFEECPIVVMCMVVIWLSSTCLFCELFWNFRSFLGFFKVFVSFTGIGNSMCVYMGFMYDLYT